MTKPADNATPTTSVTEQVVEVLRKESAAIQNAADRLESGLLSGSVEKAVQCLFDCSGRVIVTGMGKMGCIARKAAATFCSTGTPAVFLHPGEAVHGDLGIVTENDVLVVLSNSGETREVVGLLPFMARLGVPVVGLTGNANSSLGARCTAVIDTGVESEADPISIAPTNSTTVALAICDALAIALMNRRGFTKEQFAIFHPGGNLGGKLLIRVADLMHAGDSIPKISVTNTLLSDGVQVISQKGLGAVFVVSEQNEVAGIVTDGDLRRIFEKAKSNPSNVWDDALSSHMSANPKSISKDALAAEALRLMEDNGITVLPVVEESESELKPLVGVIHLHDLIRAGLA